MGQQALLVLLQMPKPGILGYLVRQQFGFVACAEDNALEIAPDPGLARCVVGFLA